jgi:hypothetical protein
VQSFKNGPYLRLLCSAAFPPLFMAAKQKTYRTWASKAGAAHNLGAGITPKERVNL